MNLFAGWLQVSANTGGMQLTIIAKRSKKRHPLIDLLGLVIIIWARPWFLRVNLEDGINHLYQAELQGPKLPETDYMIALTILYKSYYKLHKEDDGSFKEIIDRCKRAQGSLHEAQHLIGMAYYMKARLYERESSKAYDRENSTDLYQNYSELYKKAQDYLLVARRNCINRVQQRPIRPLATLRKHHTRFPAQWEICSG